MSSMDSLREKLRGRKSDTQDLAGTGELDNPFETSTTSDLPSTAELSESLFGGAAMPPTPTKKERSITDSLPAKPEKPKRVSPLMDKLQALEVNKKMLGISAAIAALASFMAVSYLNSIADPLKGQSRLVKVMILKQDVSAGTALTEPMIEIKEMPVAYLPKGYTEYKPGVAILGKVATTALYQGEVIHDKRVAMPNTSNTTVASQLPEGHRAFTITAPNAYLMKPGDFVDIMASLSDPNPTRRGKLITIPVLQRAKLLVVGGQYTTEAIAASNNSRPSNDITVAVPEDRLNLMTLLSQKGNFSVSVRPPNDQSIIPDKYTIQEIEDALLGKFGADAPPVETVADTPPEKPRALPPVEPDPPLVDLSAPAAPAYRAPARTYTPPRTAPQRPAARTQSAPAKAAAPKPAAAKPAAPAAPPKPAAPRKTVTVINGGNVVQQDGGSD